MKRLGRAIADEYLWAVKVELIEGIQKQIGVIDPNGKFHRFQHGEQFTLIGRAGKREPFITMPFSKWAEIFQP